MKKIKNIILNIIFLMTIMMSVYLFIHLVKIATREDINIIIEKERIERGE